MASSSSSSSTMGLGPCAACKAHRRKCTPDCIFAPLFPADQPQKFAIIHTVYGGSNVAKLLKELPPEDRPGAIHSLVFEADCRLRDPVYGVVGSIYLLQQQLKHLQAQLLAAKRNLSFYDPMALYVPPSSAYNNNSNNNVINDANIASGSFAYGVHHEYLQPLQQQHVSGFNAAAFHQQEGQMVGAGRCEADIFGLTAQLGLLDDEEEEVERYRQGGDTAMLFRLEEPSGTRHGGSSS